MSEGGKTACHWPRFVSKGSGPLLRGRQMPFSTKLSASSDDSKNSLQRETKPVDYEALSHSTLPRLPPKDAENHNLRPRPRREAPSPSRAQRVLDSRDHEETPDATRVFTFGFPFSHVYVPSQGEVAPHLCTTSDIFSPCSAVLLHCPAPQ